VERVRFASRVLESNPLGDPAEREIYVYLPPGYHLPENARRRYPSIYMLSGFTGRGAMLLNATGWGEPLDRRLDRLVAAGKMRPAVVVLPDCFTRFGGSQYLDSPATGRYETHLVRELVPWVDARYRTRARARNRAVVGKSSGGYGALVLGMRHPEIFGVVASHSGDAYFEYCYLPDFPHFLNEVREHGGVRQFLRAFEVAPKKTGSLVKAMNVFAMASCYSPNRRARQSYGVELPFDLETGELRPAVWRRWLKWDPVRMAPLHARQLRRLRFLFLDCGLRDEFHLHWGARVLSSILRGLGVPHVHQEFDDGHMDISYRYDVSLPLVTRHLGG
jgi:enterochelin esterase family protein